MDDPDKEPQPQVDPEMGGGGKRPPPTAVGTSGGSGQPKEPQLLLSSPMKGLVFTKVFEARFDTEPSTKMATSANLKVVVSELHRHKAKICIVVLSDSGCTKSFIGGARFGMDELCRTRTMLTEVFSAASLEQSPQIELSSQEEIRSLISAKAGEVGCFVGIPRIRDPARTLEPEGLELILRVMHGKNFGLAIFGEPLRPAMIASEYHQYQSSPTRTEHPQDSAFFSARLEDFIVGKEIGCWQTCAYFFATESVDFYRLDSLIRSAFGSVDQLSVVTFRHPQMEEHLAQFGVLSNPLKGPQFYWFQRYQYLTPLNSHALARAYTFA